MSVPNEPSPRFVLGAIGAVIILNCAFWGTVAYVVAHFVQKFW